MPAAAQRLGNTEAKRIKCREVSRIADLNEYWKLREKSVRYPIPLNLYLIPESQGSTG